MIILTLPIDGHYPKLNKSCTHVIAGSSVVSCYELDGTLIYRDFGRKPGWLSDRDFLYLKDIDDNNAELWKVNIDFLTKERIPIPTNLAAGNFFEVTDDLYAICRQEDGHLIVNGLDYGYGFSGLAVNGSYVLSVKDGRFALFYNHIIDSYYNRPDGSNKFNINAIGEIFFGYNQETKVLRRNGSIDDLTITPWRRESPIQEVSSFYWSSTETPLGKNWILGRPIGENQAIILRDIPASDFDVKLLGSDFFIAAADSSGILRVAKISKFSNLEKVIETMETKLNSPGITVSHYDRRLTESNTWRLTWYDRNNKGFKGEVNFINGSVHISFANPSGSDRTGMIRQVEIGDSVPDPIPDPIQLKGNFLCFPNYPWAFMYPGWSEDAQKYFRINYVNAGFNILPFSVWAKYDASGYPAYNYISNPSEFRKILITLKEAGIEPIIFLVTDAIGNNTVIRPDNFQEYLDFYLPKIKDLVKYCCLGWELNQVSGWSEKEGNTQSGHDMIKLSEAIRKHLSNAKIFAHFQPNWWAPHYEGGDEWNWWRDAKEVNGLLYQIRPDSSLNLNGPEVDGLYLALKYPVPGNSSIEGIAGRMKNLGKDFLMFEHSRELSRFAQVVNIIRSDSRVLGYC